MIEVKTIFNRDMLVKFNKSQIMKKIWISFIAAAALVGIGIACLFDDDLGLPFSIPVMVIGVFMPVFYVWWTRIHKRSDSEKFVAYQKRDSTDIQIFAGYDNDQRVESVRYRQRYAHIVRSDNESRGKRGRFLSVRR